VKEPAKPTEFEVQATLWSELRRLGYNARGEVGTAFADRERCRFDIAVFDRGELVGVIECKSAPIRHKSASGWNGTRQGWRYGQFGVPVMVIYGMGMVKQLVADLEGGAELFGGEQADGE
jgi:hypothetical protein